MILLKLCILIFNWRNIFWNKTFITIFRLKIWFHLWRTFIAKVILINFAQNLYIIQSSKLKLKDLSLLLLQPHNLSSNLLLFLYHLISCHFFWFWNFLGLFKIDLLIIQQKRISTLSWIYDSFYNLFIIFKLLH